MPTYVLEGGTSITLPAKPVTVRLHSQADPVRLTVLVDGSEIQAITPMPGHLVVPRVDAPTTIRVTPAGDGQRFGGGAVLNLMVGHDARSELDPDRGVLNSLDVSGLTQRDILLLEPEGSGEQSRIRVTVLGPAAAEAPLPPGASVARDAARELLGTDHIQASTAVNAVVAVDVSASMLSAVADGTVAAAVEIVAGVHRVIGKPGDSLRACLVGRRARWLPPAAPESLAASLRQECADLDLVTGFRSAAALSSPGGRADTITWLITDGVPADIDALAARDDVHLIMVVPNSARDAVDGQGLSMTVIGLPEAAGQAPRFAGDPAVVREVVASMLEPLRARLAA
ncbi:MAG: hypothetical protein L0G99_12765 [Propionibacteriales bacterium]|nr:hypothetical protein [Propionibacteriales bacterium]